MFEKDLPGENKSGLSYQKASDKLPLETCETINNSWGFNITDTTYKTHEQLLQYLVKASGVGANFLLNIGPMPNGQIQPEFIERLDWMGNWLKVYGESVYNTTTGYLRPQSWGCITQKDNKMYLHVFDKQRASIILEQFPFKKISKAYLLKDKSTVKTQLKNGMAQLFLPENETEPDEVIVLEVKS